MGGGQQRGFRGGTVPTQQVVAMAKAVELAVDKQVEESKRLRSLRDKLLAGLMPLGKISVNGSITLRVVNNLNLGIEGIDGEALLLATPELAMSTGSACNSMLSESSYVLRGIGLSEAAARSSIRISLGRFTTEEMIDVAIEKLTASIKKLRKLSPTWQELGAETTWKKS